MKKLFFFGLIMMATGCQMHRQSLVVQNNNYCHKLPPVIVERHSTITVLDVPSCPHCKQPCVIGHACQKSSHINGRPNNIEIDITIKK